METSKNYFCVAGFRELTDFSRTLLSRADCRTETPSPYFLRLSVSPVAPSMSTPLYLLLFTAVLHSLPHGPSLANCLSASTSSSSFLQSSSGSLFHYSNYTLSLAQSPVPSASVGHVAWMGGGFAFQPFFQATAALSVYDAQLDRWKKRHPLHGLCVHRSDDARSLGHLCSQRAPSFAFTTPLGVCGTVFPFLAYAKIRGLAWPPQFATSSSSLRPESRKHTTLFGSSGSHQRNKYRALTQ